MNYLLDTHAFLWAASKSKALPERVAEVIRNPHNEILVSSVTLWEIAIKVRLGKLDLDGLAAGELLPIARSMEFQLINLSPEEAISYGELTEESHKDPFDRMLIWQAITRGLTMISKDEAFRKFTAYGLDVLW